MAQQGRRGAGRGGNGGRGNRGGSYSGVPRDSKGRKRNLTPDGRKMGPAGKNGPVPKGPKGGKAFHKDPHKRPGNDRHDKGAQRQPRGGVNTANLIEGRRAVDEALAVGVPLKRAFIALGKGNQDPKLERLAREFEADGVRVDLVSKAKLDAMSYNGAHQGVVVETAPFPYVEVEDIIAKAGDGDALVIVLDHVTDEGNLGAIVRSAEVVGAAGVVIAKARAAGVGVGAYKTSAGAVMHLPIAQVPNLAKAVDKLKDAGFWACASTEHASRDVWGAPMGGRLALVMGSEGDGVSRLLLEKCDFSAKLPQRGSIESLNVAQATTVMAYEWMRRTMENAKDTAVDKGADITDEAADFGSGPALDTLGPDTGVGSYEAAREMAESEGFEAGPVITEDGING